MLVLDPHIGQHRRRQRAGAHVERAEAFEVEFGQRVAALPQRLLLVVRERPHRIGQTQVVSVHKVIAKDTVEERILHLQDAKTDLADQVIGAGGVSLASLSQEELLDLLDG